VFESKVLRLICAFKKEEPKGKIVPAHAMETYGGWGSRGILQLFINSALDGGDRVMGDRTKESNGEYCTIRHS
jgi:hypothetical protein